MSKIVQKNDWLEEEIGNMVREGFCIFVFVRKKLFEEVYVVFDKVYCVV